MSLLLHHVSHSYGTLPVFHGVDASASPGRITVLVGPNAAGKTTLLRIAAGLLQPAEGEASWHQRPVLAMRERERASVISWLSQRSRQDVPLLVGEVITLGRLRLPSADISAVVDRLDLGDLLDRPYPALSVGQQQRVGLARLLHQHEPGGLLVLDEPTAPLDPRHAAQAMGLLREVAEGGSAVVLSMHDLSLASCLADDAWLLADGALQAAGTVDAVLSPERLEAAFGLGFEQVVREDGSGWLVPLT